MAVQQIETLLEREQALAAIDELIDAATGGDGAVTVIEGSAGLGKTALLAVARDRAVQSGLDVAIARGGELEQDFAFGIVRQLLEGLVARRTAPERRELFAGAAELAAPLIAPPGRSEVLDPVPTGSFGGVAGPAMHGLYWVAVNLADDAPLLLCVDDAHWGDPPSLGWLHYLARRLEGVPIALIVARRPGELGGNEDLLGAIAAAPHSRVVRLGPLTGSGSEVLVRRALGVGAERGFCAACHAVAGGNPFLLRELTQTLAREGVPPTAASVELVRELVPDAVADSLVVRMARLPAAAAALARAVAILGSDVSLREAAALAELQHPDAARAADALAAIGILEAELPLNFLHPLVRAAVYGGLQAGERAVWHARAARVLAAGGAPSERVAAQLLRAEPEGDAWVVGCLRTAAAHAMSHADPGAAVAYLRRAFVEAVPPDERTALLQELLCAGFLAGDPTAADGLEVDPLAELAANPQALRTSAHYLAMILWSTGRTQEALTVLDRALSAAMARGDNDGALRIEVRQITFAQLPPTEALRRLEAFERQVAPGGFAGRVLDASLAWYGSLIGWSASRTLGRGRRAFADARLIRELQRDDEIVLTTLVLALLRTDELDFCERVIERILAEGRARGAASAVASGLYLSAYLAHLRGDLPHAEADARAAVAAYEAIGVIARLPPLTALFVDVLVDRGQIAEAAREISAAGMDGEMPDHWWFGPVLWSRGYLRLAQGRTRAGIDDLLEFGRRYERDGLVPTVTRPWASHAAPLLAQLGEPDAARRLAERELEEARAWGTPRVIGQALRGLGLVIGGQDGIDLLGKSVQTLEDSPARLERARALIDLGAALRRLNRRSAAREPLRRGLDLSHRCGASALAERADKELRATGARPRKLVVTGVDALTASERRIAEMAAQGLGNREIAQALFVTVKTIETHMSHVFQKLNIHARSQLPPLLSEGRKANDESQVRAEA
jgi:DNA-binding CsgD family transcriptional regulator